MGVISSVVPYSVNTACGACLYPRPDMTDRGTYLILCYLLSYSILGLVMENANEREGAAMYTQRVSCYQWRNGA